MPWYKGEGGGSWPRHVLTNVPRSTEEVRSLFAIPVFCFTVYYLQSRLLLYCSYFCNPVFVLLFRIRNPVFRFPVSYLQSRFSFPDSYW